MINNQSHYQLNFKFNVIVQEMGQVAQNPSQAQFKGFEQRSVDTQNNIYLIRNDESQEEIAIRKWFYQEQKDYTKIMQILKQRQAYSNRHLTKLIKYDLVVHDNICKDTYQIYAAWQHYPNTLHDEIKQRVNKKIKFSQEQIWKLTSGCIEALETMERNKNIHQKLTVCSIYINKQGDAILMDPLLVPNMENYSLVKRNMKTDHIYLSPEEVSSLEMETLCIKSNKNDVWALGLILLEVGLLQSQSQCYSEEGRKINWVKLTQNLNKFGRMYSERSKQVISSMLQQNKSSRPSWSELKRKFLDQPPKPSSVIKANQNAYLTTSQSPEVLAYKSMLSEQTQVYSFSRLHQFKQKNPALPEQKQNIIWNNVQMPIQYGVKQNKPIVNFIKPQIRQIPTYVPIEKTSQVQHFPSVTTKINYFRPPLSPINYQAPAVKKFVSQASSKGFLFEESKENEIKIIKPNQTKPEIQFKTNQTIISNNKIDNDYIKNTESITYQGDFRPIFRHQTNQSQKTVKLTEKHEQPVKGVENKQIEDQILPLESESVDEKNENEQIQYVIENFQVGSRYQGQKLKNMRHGEGRFYYQDGGMYDGNWQYNKMHGKGKLYYRSGALAYDGIWKNDQFQGKGKLYNETPDTLTSTYNYNNFDNVDEFWEYYEGDFVNDMKEGRGKLMLTNGQYYIGSFSQDMIQGNGKFVGKKQIVKGYWQGNQLMKIISRSTQN